jgi:hypothetical protein
VWLLRASQLAHLQAVLLSDEEEGMCVRRYWQHSGEIGSRY